MRYVLWSTALLAMLGWAAPAAESPVEEPAEPGLESFRPVWQVGDRWTVETRSRQLQAAVETSAPPVRWQFAVAAEETVGGRDALRVEAVCLEGDRPQPRVVFWVDRTWGTMLRLQAEVPVAGGFHTVTERYALVDGQPAPVQGLLTALPIDLPLLAGALSEAKSGQQFYYEALPGPGGEKPAEQLGFLCAVEQAVDLVQWDEAKTLMHQQYAKDLAPEREDPVAEVTLQAVHGQVRQLWQAGQPWPVFADNGVTESRLIQSERAPR